MQRPRPLPSVTEAITTKCCFDIAESHNRKQLPQIPADTDWGTQQNIDNPRISRPVATQSLNIVNHGTTQHDQATHLLV